MSDEVKGRAEKNYTCSNCGARELTKAGLFLHRAMHATKITYAFDMTLGKLPFSLVDAISKVMEDYAEAELSRPLDEERLKEIEQRAEKATPGPWTLRPSDEGAAFHDIDSKEWEAFARVVTTHDDTNWCPENADFIINARADIPYLLSLLRRSGLRPDSNQDSSVRFVEPTAENRAHVPAEHVVLSKAHQTGLRQGGPRDEDFRQWSTRLAAGVMNPPDWRDRDGRERMVRFIESELREFVRLVFPASGAGTVPTIEVQEIVPENWPDYWQVVVNGTVVKRCSYEGDANQLADLLRSSLGLREEGK